MGRGSLKLNNLTYQDIKVGDQFSFKKFVDSALVKQFAGLTGDYNPLHVNSAYAKKTKFGGPIAHGMLLGSFFSALVGMLCPGKKALYLSQALRFKNPLKLGSLVTVMGKVLAQSDATKIITLETKIISQDGTLIVDGLAQVKVGYE